MRRRRHRPAVDTAGPQHNQCLILAGGSAPRRDVKLGNRNGARALKGKQTGNAEAVAAIKLKAQSHAENLRAIITDLKAQGAMSIRKIADELNSRGISRRAWGNGMPQVPLGFLSGLVK